MSWVPPDPEPDRELLDAEPWRPPLLDDAKPAGFLYVVVEEFEGETAELEVVAWPVVDDRGRVRFPNDELDRVVAAPTEELHAFVTAARRYRAELRMGLAELPPDSAERQRIEAFTRRPISAGDVFAVRPVGAETALRLVGAAGPPSAWLRDLYPGTEEPQPAAAEQPPLFDITRDAREATKVAYNAAVTPPLQPDELDDLAEGMGP